MSRILAIAYGLKRCGIAISDPLKIIANAHKVVNSSEIVSYLTKIIPDKEIDTIVIGYPIGMRGQITNTTLLIDKFIQQLQKQFPNIKIEKLDERFTSKIAQRTLIETQTKKSERQKKSTTDLIAATILLQNYLDIFNTNNNINKD